MLWQLLKGEEVVEHYRGGEPQDLAALVAAVDGKALAVDLSTWIVQVGAGLGAACLSCRCWFVMRFSMCTLTSTARALL